MREGERRGGGQRGAQTGVQAAAVDDLWAGKAHVCPSPHSQACSVCVELRLHSASLTHTRTHIHAHRELLAHAHTHTSAERERGREGRGDARED